MSLKSDWLSRSHGCPLLDFLLFSEKIVDFGLQFSNPLLLPFCRCLPVLDKAVDQQLLQFRNPRALLWGQKVLCAGPSFSSSRHFIVVGNEREKSPVPVLALLGGSSLPLRSQTEDSPIATTPQPVKRLPATSLPRARETEARKGSAPPLGAVWSRRLPAMSPTAFLASAVVGRALHFAIVATLIALWGDRVMMLLSRYGRALAIISLLGLIGIAVVQHLR